jgi:hypothetical protein
MCQWRWGPGRMRRFLSRNCIAETKVVGALTERQRVLLAGALGQPTAATEDEQ